jgi:hypothetical protein
MPMIKNIEGLYDREALTILVSITNDNGTPVSNPEDFTIELKVSATPYGTALLTFDDPPFVSLVDIINAKWLIKIPRAQLSSLVVDKKYYYNIWSIESGEDPVLQAKGSLVITDAIN